MKRRREQQGTVFTKSGMWYVRYSDHRVIDGQLERKRLAKQLGAVADMTKKQARTEAKSFLARINAPTLTARNSDHVRRVCGVGLLATNRAAHTPVYVLLVPGAMEGTKTLLRKSLDSRCADPPRASDPRWNGED